MKKIFFIGFMFLSIASFGQLTKTQLYNINSRDIKSAGAYSSLKLGKLIDSLILSLNSQRRAAGYIPVGNVSGISADVPLSGDGTLSSSGTLSVTKILGNSVPSNSSGVLTNNGSGTLTWAAAAGGNPFADNTDLFKNSSDATKIIRFGLSGLTTGTTRTWTFPDVSGTFARNDAAQTFTGVQTFSSLPVFSVPLTILGTIGTGVWNGTIITSAYGGTGNGFTKFSGPTTSEKTFTLPNASATILTDNAAITAAQGGTGLASYTALDLIYASGTTTLSKLAKGTANQHLAMDGTAANIVWTTATLNPMTASGDMIYGGSVVSGYAVPARVAVGSNNQMLTLVASVPTWVSGVPGTSTNDNATTGYVGQEINSAQSTYTNYTTTATYQNISSVALTAGDWDVAAVGTFSTNSATITSTANAIFVISTTTASASGATEGVNIVYIPQSGLVGTATKESAAITAFRVSLSGSTTYYLNTQASFTVGNPQFVGSIRARRIR